MLGSRRAYYYLLVAVVAFALLAPCPADGNDGSIISNVQANNAGLTVHWFTQLNVGIQRKLVATELVIDENDSKTYFEISGGGLREVITDKDISPFGKPFGIEGAEAHAKIRQEVLDATLKFNNSSEKTTINRYSVPRSTVYALTDNGIVHAIDGESGLVLWRTQIGRRQLPTIGLGASKTHVAAVNGSRIYCLDARNGKLLFEHQCDKAVMSSPAVSEETIFVPLIGGALSALPIRTKGAGTLPLNGVGSETTTPKLAGNFVAWGSDGGYLTVSPKSDIQTMKYRVKGAGEFVAPPTSNAGMLYAVTLNGHVYAIQDRKGNLLWNFSLGEIVTQSPIALGDSLFVFTGENHVYKFDAATGQVSAGWEKPLTGYTGYVGASADRIYLRDLVGDIIAIDRVTGIRLGQVNSQTPFVTIENVHTDRIYVCTNTGMIECLRETNRIRPMFHSDENAASTGTKATPKPEEGSNPFAEGAAETDPANVFGAEPKTTDENPFGNSKEEKKANQGKK